MDLGSASSVTPMDPLKWEWAFLRSLNWCNLFIEAYSPPFLHVFFKAKSRSSCESLGLCTPNVLKPLNRLFQVLWPLTQKLGISSKSHSRPGTFVWFHSSGSITWSYKWTCWVAPQMSALPLLAPPPPLSQVITGASMISFVMSRSCMTDSPPLKARNVKMRWGWRMAKLGIPWF